MSYQDILYEERDQIAYISINRPDVVSITLTELRLASATNKRPSRPNTISQGCWPTGQRARSAPVAASSTSTTSRR